MELYWGENRASVAVLKMQGCSGEDVNGEIHAYSREIGEYKKHSCSH